MELRALFQNTGDFDGATVTYNAPGSPQTPSTQTPLELGFDSPTFASQAAMDAAYPFASYFYEATNSAKQTSESTVLLYGLDAYPSAIPAVTAGTFTALQGMNSTAPFMLNFNAFPVNPALHPGRQSSSFSLPPTSRR